MLKLRVVIATPIRDDLLALISEREPRAEIVRQSSLLPPMRHAADFAGAPSFRRTPAEQEDFENLVDSADVLYGIPDTSTTALSRTVNANPRLRWVHAMAAGAGGQVRDARLSSAQLQKVLFTTSAGVHGGPLAEFAVLGLLAGAKHVPRLQRLKAQHSWADRWVMAELADWTVVVLGGGGIAAKVAQLLRAFGTRVVTTTRDSSSAASADPGLVHIDEMDGVLAVADGVVIALPGTDSTFHLVDAKFFDKLKSGVTVVNIGRGTVVDESALHDALRDNHVGFAALDVFESEPLAPSSPLWELDNVLISPHTAALSAHEERLIAELFAENLTSFIDGGRMRNVVSTSEFY